MKIYPTKDELDKIFIYDTKTGNLIYKIKVSSKITIDSIAGSINQQGYCRIVINKKSYASHKLIWIINFGYLTERQIDHINGNKSDNRIINLREATSKQNNRNRKYYYLKQYNFNHESIYDNI